MGLSDFFLKFFITLAGALLTSAIITEVLPFSVSFSSPKSFSESSIAFSSKVFLTTDNFTPALKHILLRFDVSRAFNPEISVK